MWVLEGAKNSLAKIEVIQIEMSMIPLYENEVLFVEMLAYMSNLGFQLNSLENGFSDLGSGQLLQIDGLFSRQVP